MRYAKTTKGRAAEAIRFIKNGRHGGRELDNAFESGDGRAVLQLVLAEAFRDDNFERTLRREGMACWLDDPKWHGIRLLAHLAVEAEQSRPLAEFRFGANAEGF